MGRFIALLRGINVGSGTRIIMADLQSVATDLGWSHVRTYIQTGNLLFESTGSASEHEEKLEAAIRDRLGLSVPVIVRTAGQWHAYPAANPFPEAAEKEPNRLMLMLSKRPPDPRAAEILRPRASAGERIAIAGGALWIHYPEGAGTSKLAPSMIDRAIGSPATARNWRTVLKLEELCQQ